MNKLEDVAVVGLAVGYMAYKKAEKYPEIAFCLLVVGYLVVTAFAGPS
jgi:hypothetical protein